MGQSSIFPRDALRIRNDDEFACESLATALKNVEIEVNSRCNRSCHYCPVSVLEIPNVPRLMSEQVFRRIHNELAALDYEGRISYHFYNEPLLRRDLERLISLSKELVPKANTVLFTNGDLLTDSRYSSLMRAGLDFIVITSHDSTPHPKRSRQYVQYPADLDLTNRGGTMIELPAASQDDQSLPCYAPSEMLIITVTGDVLLCYEDAQRKHSFGNVMNTSLEKIWLEPSFVSIRQKLVRGERTQAADICSTCSNRAHIASGGSAHSEPFWKELDVRW